MSVCKAASYAMPISDVHDEVVVGKLRRKQGSTSALAMLPAAAFRYVSVADHCTFAPRATALRYLPAFLFFGLAVSAPLSPTNLAHSHHGLHTRYLHVSRASRGFCLLTYPI